MRAATKPMNSPAFHLPLPTRICIVRHGETDWNAERRIQGQIDIPLNATGYKQAFAAARGLAKHEFAALYSSDLQRARDTAAAAAQLLELPLQMEPGLRERHYGDYQGLTQGDIKARDDFDRYISRDPHFSFGSGESLAGFAERIKTTINRLAQRHAGQTIVLFAHGGVLDVIYRISTYRPLETARDFPIPNAALNWIEVGSPGWQLLDWGVQSHLDNSLELTVE